MKKYMFSMVFLVSSTAYAQTTDDSKEVDNGTDPTKLSNTIAIYDDYDHLVNGVGSHAFTIMYTKALPNRFSLRFKVPLPKMTNLPSAYTGHTFGLGDASVKLGRVLARNRSYGVVVGAELVFNTATDDILGSGKNVLKLNGTYAKFLSNGAIFAPSVVHSVSLWGDRQRADVNSTTADFYYVPKLATKKYFVTIDPAITRDWKGDKTYGSLAVNMGMQTGKAFGGNSQIYVKPQVLFGADRPSNWGVEMGYKVIGF